MNPKRSSASSRPSLASIAAKELRTIRDARPAIVEGRKTLWEFIPFAQPGYAPPYHLRPLIESFIAAVEGKRQRVICHAPPRHGKSDSILIAMVWALYYNPKIRFSYSTYNDTFAQEQSARALVIAERVGLLLRSKKKSRWVTTEGGGIIFGGVGSGLTGKGVDIAVVDDPHKDRVEAESEVMRNRVYDWAKAVVTTRIEGTAATIAAVDLQPLEPDASPAPEYLQNTSIAAAGNGSVFVFMTRWHEDDLSGRLKKEGGWNYINLPAINEKGEALWPARWNAATLALIRVEVTEYNWSSLYQGDPQPRGGRVFNDVSSYDVLPSLGVTAFGIDLAYTSKTTADFSVAVEMLRANMGTAQSPNWHYFVVNVVRQQTSVTKFKAVLAEMASHHPNAGWRWYAYGPEKNGVGDNLRPTNTELGIPLKTISAPGDKFIRAIPCSAAWNKGIIHVPKTASWLNDFVTELAGFTGVGGGRDDQVDAIVAAFDELNIKGGMQIPSIMMPTTEGTFDRGL